MFQQIAVHENFGDSDGQKTRYLHLRFLKLWFGYFEHLAKQIGELRRLQPHIDRARKIQKAFHNRVQPIDLHIEHMHCLQRRAVRIGGQRLFQILQPEPHGVQRVLYLMGYTRRDASDGGEPLADLQLRVNALDGIQVAQGDQRAHAVTRALDFLHAHPHTPAPHGGLNFGFRRHFSQVVAIEMQRFKQRMPRRKNIRHAPAEEIRGWSTQEFFRGRAYHHRARVLREEKQAVFQAGHHGIHVLAKGTEDFVNSTQLLADLLNLLAHLAEFVGGLTWLLCGGRWSVIHAHGDAFELSQNVADWRQRSPAYHRGEKRGQHQSQNGNRAPALQPGSNVIKQQRGGDGDSHFAERIPPQFEWIVHFVDARLFG